jgi:ankyrin repeat protein
VRVVKALIDAGAPLEAVGEAGYRPLQLAVVQGNIDIIKALAEGG